MVKADRRVGADWDVPEEGVLRDESRGEKYVVQDQLQSARNRRPGMHRATARDYPFDLRLYLFHEIYEMACLHYCHERVARVSFARKTVDYKARS